MISVLLIPVSIHIRNHYWSETVSSKATVSSSSLVRVNAQLMSAHAVVFGSSTMGISKVQSQNNNKLTQTHTQFYIST